MRSGLIICISLFCFSHLLGQEKEIELHAVDSNNDTLYGTLVLAEASIHEKNKHCVFIIAGSGPTDRDGNSMGFKNNSLKQIAAYLEKKDISTFRYDKRGVGKSRNAFIPESELTFDQNLLDAKLLLNMLKDKGFSSFDVIGHSQGSLVGSLLCQGDSSIQKFVSVAGPGRNIADVLKEQYLATSKEVSDSANVVIDLIKSGEKVENLAPWLFTVFRPSIQDYMHSWMAYEPVIEFQKVSIPKFIIQGTTDIQVSLMDAELLAGNEKKNLFIIQNMNHVLKYSSSDRAENKATYLNPELPLHIQFCQTLDIIFQ